MIRNRLARANVFAMALAAFFCFSAAVVIAAQISIVSPAAEETIHDNSGNLTVEVAAHLDEGSRVRLLIDGAPAAHEGRSTTFHLQGVNRGEHILKAQLLDGDEITAESGEVIFYMWQASRLNPAR